MIEQDKATVKEAIRQAIENIRQNGEDSGGKISRSQENIIEGLIHAIALLE